MAEQHAAMTGDALFATEWGALTDPNAIRENAKAEDEAMMAWLYWTWANKTPYPIPGVGNIPTGSENQGLVQDLSQARKPGNLHEDRLDALVRPYPRAIAGTPEGFSFNPESRVFKLVYTPEALPGKTGAPEAQPEIFCPPRQYPKGYRVQASGATVVSQPGEPILRLANQAKAPLVRITIQPAESGGTHPVTKPK